MNVIPQANTPVYQMPILDSNATIVPNALGLDDSSFNDNSTSDDDYHPIDESTLSDPSLTSDMPSDDESIHPGQSAQESCPSEQLQFLQTEDPSLIDYEYELNVLGIIMIQMSLKAG